MDALSWQTNLNMRSNIPNLQATMYYFACHINILITFLPIFRRFPTAFRRVTKIFKHLSEGHLKFSKVSEDNQRLAMTFDQDPKVFRSYIDASKYTLRNLLRISSDGDLFKRENNGFRYLVFARYFIGINIIKTLTSLLIVCA